MSVTPAHVKMGPPVQIWLMITAVTVYQGIWEKTVKLVSDIAELSFVSFLALG